jgi:PAS domain S-box-containing protein
MCDRPSYEELEKRLKDLEQEHRLATEAARESEERCQALFERSFDVVYILDFEGKFLDASNAGFNLLGYSREELKNITLTTLLTDDQIPLVFSTIEELKETGTQKESDEYMVRHKDGSFVWLETRASVIYRTGEPYAIQGIARDITEWKNSQEHSKKSEERYRAIFENTGNATILIGEDKTILLANSNFERLSGYSRHEIEGRMSWVSFISENDLERLKNYHRMRRDKPGSAPESYEFRFITRSGEVRDILALVTLIPGTNESISNHIDITERKQAEEALRISEDKYRGILESMEESYFEVDFAGNFTFFNNAACRMSGYSPEELLGMNYRTYAPPETARLMFEAFNKVYKTGKPELLVDYQVIHKDGSLHDNELSVGLMRDALGQPVGFTALVRDVTVKKRSEKTLRESEERYRSILDNMEEAYYEVDLKGNFTFFNPRAVNRLGYTVEELNGMNFRNYVDEENAKKVFNAYHQVYLTGEPFTGVDWELKDKSGRSIFVEASVSLRLGADGTPTGFRGVVRDITSRKQAEDALRVSEEKYRTILESMEEAYLESDLNGNFTFFNDSLSKVLGYTRDELKGMTYRAISTSETSTKLYQLFNEIYNTGQPKTLIDHEIIRKDGSKRVIEMSVSLIREPSGEPTGFRGVGRDITERIQAEGTIKKSEEFYRTIFEKTGNASLLLDEDTTILLANSNFEKLSGYSRQDLEGKMGWTVFVSPDDLTMMKNNHEMRRREHSPAPDSYEFQFINSHGEKRDIFLNIALIPGTKISIASLMDITDRKRTEKALRESEERFRDMASLLPETVFEIDENGRVTFVNQSSLERFGFTMEEVEKGLNFLEAIAPEDHERIIKNSQKVMHGEHIGLNEYTARRKDGRTFPALINTVVINHDGKPAGLRGFLIDMTEKKNLEQQLTRAQKMEAIGTLAGGIAHDFNNLLMGILGNVSLVLMHFDESNPFFDRLKSVEEYVKRGSDLTKQLLGFARGGKYEVKPTHLGEFIQKSSEMFGRTKKEIRIHHKVAQDLWAVDVDRGQMEQVMLNLFVNAWQAMPGGGDLFISVENLKLDEVEVSPYDIMPGRFVKVTVTDTGIGMDDSVKMRIFEPFFTTKERGRGTGLGLASVYGIIKNHSGFIRVESEKDLGTSFMIYLPASDKDIPDEHKTNGEIKRGHETVLLIDDEEMILDIGSKMLEGLGYKVLAAPGGRQGLQIYEQARDKVELVILDMIMPDFGGKETFDTLRRVNPDVKVLLSSGYSLDGQAKDIMKSGCKGFIQKPFSMADFSKKIRDILDQE